MKVPFVDFTREYAALQGEIMQAIERVLESGWYILHEECEHFEKEFARYIGTSYGIGVNSGSDALFLAIKALDLRPQHEVITVSHTFISTVDAIIRNNVTPVFVDIDPETYTMDVTQIEEKITPHTKAILPVHLYGHPADMKPIMELAERYDLSVIEDACQAHGAEYYGKKVGGLGDIGCFSFYPTKNMGAYGDGGLIVTNDEDLAERLRMLRNYGQMRKNYHEILGVNSRLDEVQAAVLRVKLNHLDEWNQKRKKNAGIYRSYLVDEHVSIPIERKYASHVYHLYVMRSETRDDLQQYLAKSNIQTQIHYPVPVHQQKVYLDRGFNIHLPVTENTSHEIISLPMNPWLKDDEITYICDAIHSLC